MSSKSHSTVCNYSAICAWAMAAYLLSIPLATSAQSGQGGSLADAARQVRAQKAGASEGAGRAQQVAAELSDDQNDSAPGGFKTFNAGDYALWVPAPYKVEGNDSAGIVLAGPMMGVKHAVVLVGTPMAARWQNDDAAFEETVTKFAHLYSESAHCAKVTIANHTAYQCGLAAANLLGSQVSGNAVFMMAAGNIYPVFCVSPTDSRSRDLLNNARASSSVKDWSRENLDREEQDTRRVWQQCDSVFQSFRLKPTAQPVAEQASKSSGDPSGTAALTGPGQTAKLVTTTSGAAADGNARAAVVEATARTNQGPVAAPETPAVSGNVPAVSTAPAGFKSQPLKYCKGQSQCWDASFNIPAEAQLISSDCGQYTFQIKVQGEPFLLMAGSNGGSCGRAANDANLVRWKDLADPETMRAPGTSSTISSLQGTLSGVPAIITTIGFRKGLVEWMGKRAEVESNGVPLVVGCTATRAHFYDGDAACSALIESLRLQQ